MIFLEVLVFSTNRHTIFHFVIFSNILKFFSQVWIFCFRFTLCMLLFPEIGVSESEIHKIYVIDAIYCFNCKNFIILIYKIIFLVVLVFAITRHKNCDFWNFLKLFSQLWNFWLMIYTIYGECFSPFGDFESETHKMFVR